MFNRSGSNTNSNYSKVHLDDFSDDSDNAGRDDFVESSLRNQQVRTNERTRKRMLHEQCCQHQCVSGPHCLIWIICLFRLSLHECRN